MKARRARKEMTGEVQSYSGNGGSHGTAQQSTEVGHL